MSMNRWLGLPHYRPYGWEEDDEDEDDEEVYYGDLRFS